MITPDVRTRLSEALRGRDEERISSAVQEATTLGDVGEELLTDALLTLRGFRRVVIASMIGDVHGGAGSQALRRVTEITGPGTVDTICAALLALARRDGEAATDDLRRGLRHRNANVRGDAITGLAGAGDDSARDDVTNWLRNRIKRPVTSEGAYPVSDIFKAVCYLARHAPTGSDHALALITLLRSNWANLQRRDRRFLRAIWPDLAPEVPIPAEMVTMPDPDLLVRISRGSLFNESEADEVLEQLAP